MSDDEDDSTDSKSDLITSSLAMIVLGLIIFAIGAWCAIGFAALFDVDATSISSGSRVGYRHISLYPFFTLGFGVLIGMGGGLWLIFCGIRVLIKMSLGHKKLD